MTTAQIKSKSIISPIMRMNDLPGSVDPSDILSQKARAMPNNIYFNIKRDQGVINAGGFFCDACLVGKSVNEVSPDLRYCQCCYEFLLKEAKILSPGKRPAWIPKPQKAEKASTRQYQVSGVGDGIMSTVGGKRGPKYRPLPEDFIIKLASRGIGSKAITSRLKHQHGIKLSYKTIQRVLSGKRMPTTLPGNQRVED